mmetsp:Transcript_33479/g.109694  ORF Transcript_33479/g.109694 Transcript_33479/m.109694 type:complete len:465 (+) Transcript_33479:258-1652(+)
MPNQAMLSRLCTPTLSGPSLRCAKAVEAEVDASSHGLLRLDRHATNKMRRTLSSVQVVVIVRRGGSGSQSRSVRPLDVQRAIPAGVLVEGVELLPELVVLREVVLCYRATGSSESLLEVLPADLVSRIHGIIITCLQLFGSDGISNCSLGGPLAQLGQVGTTEALRLLCDERHGHVRSDRRFLERGIQDALASRQVRQRDVDELVKTARSEQRLVQELGTVGRTDEEDVLLHTDAVDLRQELVHHTVTSTTGIAASTRATSCTNGVQLVEEQHARCRSASLVENLTYIRLGLTEPHRQKLGALDAHKVRRALARHCLGEQCLATTRWAIEQHTSRWLHAELLEFLGVVNRVQDHLLQGALRLFQATNVVPLDVRHLDDGLAQGRGIALAHGAFEVILRHCHGVEDFGIDGLFVKVDKVHLLSDARQGCLRAQLRQVCTDETVRVRGEILKLHIWSQLHVLGLNA